MAEIFEFEKIVYLCDTNAEGNVYFARFFDWQGMAREEFLRKNVPNHMQILQSGIRLITVNAWMSYQSECTLFNSVLVQIQTTNLKHMSLELAFTFINQTSKNLVGHGGERLAFASGNGQLLPIPDTIQENARRFLIPSSPEQTDLGSKIKNDTHDARTKA